MCGAGGATGQRKPSADSLYRSHRRRYLVRDFSALFRSDGCTARVVQSRTKSRKFGPGRKWTGAVHVHTPPRNVFCFQIATVLNRKAVLPSICIWDCRTNKRSKLFARCLLRFLFCLSARSSRTRTAALFARLGFRSTGNTSPLVRALVVACPNRKLRGCFVQLAMTASTRSPCGIGSPALPWRHNLQTDIRTKSARLLAFSFACHSE